MGESGELWSPAPVVTSIAELMHQRLKICYTREGKKDFKNKRNREFAERLYLPEI